MKKQLGKTYFPEEFENSIYKTWSESGYFHAEPDSSKKPYCIVIPPPNITGQLHIGHALDNTLQDILIRFRRMQGYCTLWLPGTDHASIATEAKIVEAMALEGLTKEDIGREAFLERAWDWKKHFGGRIIDQLKKLGNSCDWERERFTLDEGLSTAVKEVFVNLYEKGLIYRGERITNWCPTCGTSISDAEVEYSDKEGFFWHIKYPIKDSAEYLVIATTRPETMLGDTAIAINPNDERYIKYLGKTVILPLLNKEIPVIADDYVDMDFGTGVVKITPAHDPNDFEVGLRHNLPIIRVMDDKAYMNEFAGPYEGLERYEARKKIVADLETQDLLLEIEPHQHNVGECYRCSTVIEPIISMQWFVNMKPLAEPAIKAVRNDEVQFCPDRFSKIYFNWMENIKDWCISRQLWWGHRIPAYYCGNCGHITVSKVEVTKCEKCDSTDIRQDEDTLDTWFSSALWPFSTLGWPEKTKDLEYFYPTSVLVTAYDIIFFWVARMIFSGYEHMGQRPFEKVFIHGLVRDSQGKKMSKSLGNGIDPLALIEKYGADALRFAMSMGVSPGSDVRFSEEKIESARNIINKIWNAARFVMIQTDDADNDNTDISVNELTLEDKWILSRLNIIVDEITENLDKFEIGLALQKVYEFFREEFCDWYIELVKPRLYDNSKPTGNTARKVLVKVLSDSMKLFHPFIPFVTEEIYLAVNEDEKSIMISEWPIVDESFIFPEEESKMRLIMDAIRSIRNARAEINVPPSIKAEIFFVCSDETIKSSLELGRYYLERLAFASKINIFVKGSSDVVIPDNAVSAFVDGLDIYLPLDQLVDIEKEIVRLTEEQANLQGELDRVNGKLTNNSFVDRAPAKVVEEERAKLDKYNSMYKSVTEKLFQLKQMKKGD